MRACRPYRAQTKGKVERPIRYIRESFFYGRDFVSDADLNARAREWREAEANVRNHGTLKERPVDRFEREREYLTPLASWPYRSVVIPSPVPESPEATVPSGSRIIDVERRPLTEYARLTGGVA